MYTARMISKQTRAQNAPQVAPACNSGARMDVWHDASLFRALARGAGMAGIVQATSIVAGIVLAAVLARTLGALEFGIYALSMNQAQLLAAGVGWGIPLTVLRFFPQYIANNQSGHARGVVRVFSTATYTSGVFLAILGLPIVLLSSQGLSVEQPGILLLTFSVAGLLCAGNFQMELARANKRLLLAYFPIGAAWPFGMIFVYVILLLGGGSVTAQSVLITSASLLLAALLAQLSMLRKLVADVLGSTQPRYEPRAWCEVALPLWMITLGSMILATSDVLLVGLLAGETQAASYFVAKRLSALVSFSLAALNTVVAPLISEYFHTSRRRALEATLTNAALLIFVPALLCSVALFSFGHVFLGIFGNEFTKAWPVLCVLVVGQLVNASTGAVGYLMSLTGHQLTSMIVYASAAALQIVLSLLLVPKLGAVGAAIASAVSMSCWNICLVIYVWRRLRLDPTIFRARRLLRRMKGTL